MTDVRDRADRLDDRRQDTAETRAMPDCVEAEQALIGAVLVNNDAWRAVSGLVDTEDFHERAHAVIWEAVDGLCKQGVLVTPKTLIPWLGRADLGGVTVPEYLARLTAEAVTVVNAPDYARTVRNVAARRRLISAAHKLMDAAYDSPVSETPDRIIERAQDDLEAARPSGVKDGRTRALAAQLVAEVVDKADMVARGDAALEGATTGLADLDRAIIGFNAGELVIIAGRPGMGKSTLATSLALACSNPDQPRAARALFLSLELTKAAIASRLAADAAFLTGVRIAHSDIRAGRLAMGDVDHLRAAEDLIAGHRLTVEYAKGRSLREIETIVQAENKRLARSGEKLDVVFVDQLKQIKAPERYKGNRNNEIGEIVWGLREMAQRHGLCVVLMCQLNRSVEARDVKNKRPNLGDLRDSGEIEQDADVVLFVYREAYYLKKQMDAERDHDKAQALRDLYEGLANDLEIIVAKNRHGDQQTVKAFCDIAASAVRPVRGDMFRGW